MFQCSSNLTSFLYLCITAFVHYVYTLYASCAIHFSIKRAGFDWFRIAQTSFKGGEIKFCMPRATRD